MSEGTNSTLLAEENSITAELSPEQQLVRTAKDQFRALVVTLNQIQNMDNITITPSLYQNDYAEWQCSLVVRKTVYL